jgi:hypothetical protein
VLRYLTVKLADEIDTAGIDQEKERIAAIAAAIVAEAEELARQNEDAENGDDKAEEKAEEKVAISEESDTPKQEQQDDSAE